MRDPAPKPAEVAEPQIGGASRRTGPSAVEWVILIVAALFALGLALFLAYAVFNFQIVPA